MHKPKTLAPDKDIVKSLIALRDECYYKSDNATIREIFFKINSCLYDRYPANWLSSGKPKVKRGIYES